MPDATELWFHIALGRVAAVIVQSRRPATHPHQGRMRSVTFAFLHEAKDRPIRSQWYSLVLDTDETVARDMEACALYWAMHFANHEADRVSLTRAPAADLPDPLFRTLDPDWATRYRKDPTGLRVLAIAHPELLLALREHCEAPGVYDAAGAARALFADGRFGRVTDLPLE